MLVAIAEVGNGTVVVRRDLIQCLQAQGYRVCRIGQVTRSDEIHPDYERLQVEYVGVPLERTNVHPLRELKGIAEVRRVLKKNEVQGVIIYGVRMFPSMVTAAKLAGVKRVLCVVNGTGRLFRMRGLKGFFVRFVSFPMLWLAFLLSDHIFFQNEDDLKLVRSKGLLWKRKYTIVHGSGVNLEHFSLADLPDEPVFLMVSRLTASKGVNEYVRAALEVREKYPEARFYLVGPMDDDDRSLDQGMLQKAAREGTVILTGWVDDVRPFIEKARVFVLPSYHEGTPRTVLEAMAMGRPIITTDAPGCKETVEEGVNGFRVPVEDVDMLVDRMIWMIENHDAVQRMAVNSRILCERKYDVRKVNGAIIEELGI